MLERLPIEIGHKILLEHSDGPWELEDNVNTASLVCKEWRHRLWPLRVPHLQTRNSLALARARPQFERERATTVLVGITTPIEELPPRLWHQRAAVADLHKFLALYPNARRAVLVNLTPIVDLQSGRGRGLRG